MHDKLIKISYPPCCPVLFFLKTFILVMFSGLLLGGTLPPLSETEVMRLAEKIWDNECNRKIKGLTTWNQGEDCASMGIGHFIWYPEGRRGPYEETFPLLLAFLEKRGATLPSWLQPKRSCPWHVKEVFEKDLYELPMRQLRNFLYETRSLQAQFMVERLGEALTKMLATLPPKEHQKIENLFHRLSKDPRGLFALLDYCNFKGYGTLPTERYAGEGWGLLQVLQHMSENSADLLEEFIDTAKKLLNERVKNAPAIRKEDQWLKGWYHRINRYRDP